MAVLLAAFVLKLASGPRDGFNVPSHGMLMFGVPAIPTCGPPACWIFEGGSSWLNAEPFTMAGQLPEPAPGFLADDGMTEFSMLVKCCLERALIFGLTSPPRETRNGQTRSGKSQC